MAVPKVELIAQNIVTTLRGITVANDYSFTMAGVERRKINTQNPPTHLTAVLSYVSDTQVARTVAHQRRRQTFSVDVTYVSQDSAESTQDQEQVEIWADVSKALLVDRTRGGNAWDTTEPSFIIEDDKVSITFEVEYQVDTDDPRA